MAIFQFYWIIISIDIQKRLNQPDITRTGQHPYTIQVKVSRTVKITRTIPASSLQTSL